MKIRIGLIVTAFLLFTTACGTATSESSDAVGESANQTNEQTDSNGALEEKGVNLTNYRAEEGVVKSFTSNGQPHFNEEIIDQNKTYVQRVITLGSMKTLQILKWTEEDVSIVEEESNPEQIQSKLDGFEAVEEVDTLLTLSDESNRTVTLLESVEVPYGTFEDVIEMKRSIGEENMVVTTYYAPNTGLIKQVYEIGGDQPQKEIVELASIK
ncbi:hypothetical protein ABFG93_14655 [Pseudalkalibacillus hwajinpoensis]|uniref:hypothetical protein n=1 Tax=Guptibacillus hwajinpoensis TaxID=208199 RepID=UPI00325BDF74